MTERVRHARFSGTYTIFDTHKAHKDHILCLRCTPVAHESEKTACLQILAARGHQHREFLAFPMYSPVGSEVDDGCLAVSHRFPAHTAGTLANSHRLTFDIAPSLILPWLLGWLTRLAGSVSPSRRAPGPTAREKTGPVTAQQLAPFAAAPPTQCCYQQARLWF
jgi:hypothetical protein